jgi:hypothetical protein
VVREIMRVVGLELHLALAAALGVGDGHQGVVQHAHKNHGDFCKTNEMGAYRYTFHLDGKGAQRQASNRSGIATDQAKRGGLAEELRRGKTRHTISQHSLHA